MIKDFNTLKSLKNISSFQHSIIRSIEDLLNRIDLDQLHEKSFIEITEKYIAISLLHVKDNDTIITINILRERVSLWYSECELKFNKDPDIISNFDLPVDQFHLTLENCLKGNYYADDYYYKKKRLFSVMHLGGVERTQTVIINIFYKFYVWFYKSEITFKRDNYLAFFSHN